MQIEEAFIPSVLVALSLGELRFCLGATMAVRRNVLAEIGGLAALGSVLADDHALGELVSARGHRIELSRYVVKTLVPEAALGPLWSHELRWARTNLALAPTGYAFSFLMYALPLALLYVAVSRNLAWGLPLLAVVLLLRLRLHYLARSCIARLASRRCVAHSASGLSKFARLGRELIRPKGPLAYGNIPDRPPLGSGGRERLGAERLHVHAVVDKNRALNALQLDDGLIEIGLRLQLPPSRLR